MCIRYWSCIFCTGTGCCILSIIVAVAVTIKHAID